MRVRFGADGLQLFKRVAAVGDTEKLRKIYECALEASKIDEVAKLVRKRSSSRRKSR